MITKKNIDSSTTEKKPSQSVSSSHKFSYFEMEDGTLIKQQQCRVYKTPRNSLYAQRFKKAKNSRPYTSQPEQKVIPARSCSFRKVQQSSMGIAIPFFVSNKPSTRHVSRSLVTNPTNLMRKNFSMEKHQKITKQNHQFRNQSFKNIGKHNLSQAAYNQMATNMNQYFNLMKLSINKRSDNINSQVVADRRQIKSENKLREQQKYWYLNNQNNLKIQAIKPSIKKQSKDTSKIIQQKESGIQKLVTEEAVPLDAINARAFIKYRSTFNKDPQRKLRKSASPTKDISKISDFPSPQKRISYLTDYFGKVKDNIPLQDIQRLKALYYRDIIWKMWFNSGWKVKIQSYNETLAPPRFFVGRGNNSKLVRSIMSKRWWWKLQTKQENANFFWTQLKIYSAYQLQKQFPKVTIFQSEDQVNEKIQQQDNYEQYLNSKNIATLSPQKMENQKAKQQQNFYYDEDWWNQRKTIADKNAYILTYKKYMKWQNYLKNINNLKKEAKSSQSLQNRKYLQKSLTMIQKYPEKVTNHLQYSRLIGNKKALYRTMSMYYELSKKQNKFLPLTYHITNGLQDQEYTKFLTQYYRKLKQQNNSMWIVKPGEMSNRGCGIKVCKDIHDVKNLLKNKKTHTNGKSFTYIIQQYLRQPFLYQGRKFDIRHYIMMNSEFGRIKGYFYEEGYIRTTSYKYSTKNHDSYVHLTNDAVQKYCKDYGKYEKGNKVSYQDFQKYLKSLPQATQKKYSFYEQILPKIRKISIDIMNASYYLIDPNRKGNNFQIFGLDIMIDANFRPWLIQVNTNPCLQLSSPVLARLIPKMLDNAFTISLDPLFPPPLDVSIMTKKNNLPDNYISHNQFQLVFDQVVEGNKLNRLYNGVKDKLSQMEGYGSDQQAYESAEDQCDADL